MSFFRRRPPGSSSSTLVSFYEGTGRDHGGRRLTDILQWDADRLESSHDYIQTLFPLPEESGVNWNAPIIDRQVFDAFRSRNELQGKLRDSFQKILWFYGFKLERIDGEIKVGNFLLAVDGMELIASRSPRVTTIATIPRIGTPDSTTITSESRESFALSECSVLKTKPKHSTMP